MKLLHRLHNPSQSDNSSTWVVEHKTHPKTPTHTHTHKQPHCVVITSRLWTQEDFWSMQYYCSRWARLMRISYTYIHTYLERGGGGIRDDDIDWTATFGSRCALELRQRRRRRRRRRRLLHWVGNQYCAFLLLLPQIVFFRRQLLHVRRRKSEFGPVFFTLALTCRSSTSLCGNHR
jgi:hypothetical protein